MSNYGNDAAASALNVIDEECGASVSEANSTSNESLISMESDTILLDSNLMFVSVLRTNEAIDDDKDATEVYQAIETDEFLINLDESMYNPTNPTETKQNEFEHNSQPKSSEMSTTPRYEKKNLEKQTELERKPPKPPRYEPRSPKQSGIQSKSILIPTDEPQNLESSPEKRKTKQRANIDETEQKLSFQENPKSQPESINKSPKKKESDNSGIEQNLPTEPQSTIHQEDVDEFRRRLEAIKVNRQKSDTIGIEQNLQNEPLSTIDKKTYDDIKRRFENIKVPKQNPQNQAESVENSPVKNEGGTGGIKQSLQIEPLSTLDKETYDNINRRLEAIKAKKQDLQNQAESIEQNLPIEPQSTKNLDQKIKKQFEDIKANEQKLKFREIQPENAQNNQQQSIDDYDQPENTDDNKSSKSNEDSESGNSISKNKSELIKSDPPMSLLISIDEEIKESENFEGDRISQLHFKKQAPDLIKLLDDFEKESQKVKQNLKAKQNQQKSSDNKPSKSNESSESDNDSSSTKQKQKFPIKQSTLSSNQSISVAKSNQEAKGNENEFELTKTQVKFENKKMSSLITTEELAKEPINYSKLDTRNVQFENQNPSYSTEIAKPRAATLEETKKQQQFELENLSPNTLISNGKFEKNN